jgi:hypothetical protein
MWPKSLTVALHAFGSYLAKTSVHVLCGIRILSSKTSNQVLACPAVYTGCMMHVQEIYLMVAGFLICAMCTTWCEQVCMENAHSECQDTFTGWPFVSTMRAEAVTCTLVGLSV